MKILKLTVALSFLISGLVSCEKEYDTVIRKNDNITMTGANVVPANSSTGSAKLQVSYNNRTRLLSYTVSWTGLSANVNAIRISGPADPGFAAAPLQNFTSGFAAATSGTYSNTLYVDGFVVKEDDLLNGKYYMGLHTVGPYASSGEVRGQIVFTD